MTTAICILIYSNQIHIYLEIKAFHVALDTKPAFGGKKGKNSHVTGDHSRLDVSAGECQPVLLTCPLPGHSWYLLVGQGGLR